jgi:hypothetical protein
MLANRKLQVSHPPLELKIWMVMVVEVHSLFPQVVEVHVSLIGGVVQYSVLLDKTNHARGARRIARVCYFLTSLRI